MRRLATVIALAMLGPAADAHADFLLVPFIGTTFGAETPLLPFEGPPPKHWIVGGSAAWLGDQVFGLEADVAFAPRFFETENEFDLVTESGVTTLFGSLIATVPVSVSREGLRPYLLGGVGLVRITVDDIVSLVNREGNEPLTDNTLGLQLGGGAIGLVTDRTGVRFDLRHVRSLERGTDEIRLERVAKLSFWRATLGVVIRY